ncbi:FecR family protein [Oceanobacter antarcticus]|jgi:transmembrane sensor|uniref:FecR domain-containing protein n=1 Tax=Oceanobacter antarcticus TaxID=3133425 RepID=A0ABW8NIF2_9GAMM
MNKLMFSDDVLEAATDWYDRMEELTPEQLQSYQSWLEQRHEHRAAAEYIARYFGDNEALAIAVLQRSAAAHFATSAATEGSPASHPSVPPVAGETDRIEPSASTSLLDQIRAWFSHESLQPLLAPLMLVILLLPPAIGYVVLSQPATSNTLSYATERAERQDMLLEDGSRVVLNADSRVQVTLGESQRYVALNKGEAYFSVSKDKQRPFIVDTDLGQIRVVGTAFNVDRSGDHLVVVVEHGIVEVTAAGTTLQLLAGDGLRLAEGTLSMFRAADAAEWRSGWREVSEEPLSELIAHLQQYTAREIVLDQVDTRQVFSGRYSQADVQTTLALIANLFDLKLQVTDDRLLLSGR